MSSTKTEEQNSNIVINMAKEEMENKLKFSCRLCMDEKRSKVSLYEVTSRRIQLTNADILSLFTDIFPEQGDGLPEMICTKCENMLHLILDFKFECQETNETLRAFYDSLHPKVVEEEENVPEMLDETELYEGNMAVEVLEDEFERDDNTEEERIASKTEDFEDIEGQEVIEEVQNVSENEEKEDLIVISVVQDNSETIENEETHVKSPKPRRKCSKCPECGKMVEGPAKLTRHMRVHDRERNKLEKKESKNAKICSPSSNTTTYNCTECQKVFNTTARLKKHQETHLPMTMREKSFVCYCGKKYLDSAALRSHMLIAHSDNVPMYACEICKKEFTRKNYRDYHQRLHTSDKPHACHICNFRTAKKHNLSRHLLVHSDEYNFECETCHKMFKRKTGLDTHRKTHSCNRSFMCPECQRAYPAASNLITHLRHVHQIEMSPEEFDLVTQPQVSVAEVEEEEMNTDDLVYALEEIATE